MGSGASPPFSYNSDMPSHAVPETNVQEALQRFGYEKRAFDFSSLGKGIAHAASKAAPYAIGAGIPLITAGGLLLSKPGIQAELKHNREFAGDTQQADAQAAIPEPVMNTASQVHQELLSRGIDPASLRIAVDAPPGSGKTVLSKALAQQMNMKHYGLDWLPHHKIRNLLSGGSHIEQMPRAPHAGEILEHANILRGYDPELFDVIFHIHKDPEVIRQQILNRGRGARNVDFVDYDKNLGVGRLAFSSLAGDPIDLGGGTMMKIRPREGWGTEKLDEQLQGMGIDTSNMTRHEKLLSIHAGKRERGSGWTPYVKNPLSGGQTALLAASVPIGIGAALAAKHYLH